MASSVRFWAISMYALSTILDYLRGSVKTGSDETKRQICWAIVKTKSLLQWRRSYNYNESLLFVFFFSLWTKGQRKWNGKRRKGKMSEALAKKKGTMVCVVCFLFHFNRFVCLLSHPGSSRKGRQPRFRRRNRRKGMLSASHNFESGNCLDVAWKIVPSRKPK